VGHDGAHSRARAASTRILSGLGYRQGERACGSDERALEKGGRLGSNRLDGGWCGRRRMLLMRAVLAAGFSVLDSVLLVD
jgi:hypothetical protein